MIGKRVWGSLFVFAVAVAGVGIYRQASADTAPTIQIAIPNNVDITVSQHVVVFIGKPTATSPVNCAPGTPFPQTVVALDPQGGIAAQITGVLAFHDHEIPLSSRYEITGGGSPCNDELKLYTATLK